MIPAFGTHGLGRVFIKEMVVALSTIEWTKADICNLVTPTVRSGLLDCGPSGLIYPVATAPGTDFITHD